MKFKSTEAEQGYKKGFDAQEGEPYGERCYTYARDWADEMEKEMEQGKELEEVAQAASHKADTDGITGFMFGVAVSILAQTWEHGDRLRKWHNAQYGRPEAEGTINPALLEIQ